MFIFRSSLVKNQSAFITVRNISESIMLAQEMIKGFNLKSCLDKVCIQLDISKAFDTLIRDFLLLRLRRMGYKEQLISWIKVCIITPSFIQQIFLGAQGG